MKNHPGIRIDKISVSGLAGITFVIGTLYIFLVGVPATRALLVSMAAGVVGGIILYLWRNQTRW
jgi:hypothetical protein